VDAEDRKGEPLDPDPEADRDARRDELAAELLPPAQAAEVVDRADGRRHGGAEQQAAHAPVELEKRERGDEDPEEQREAAEPRHRAGVGAAAVAGAVDDAEHAGHAADGRRQEHDDHEGDDEAVDDLGVLPELVADHFVP
jgi:hypothetical protein